MGGGQGGVGCWGAGGADKAAGVAAFSSGKQQGVPFTAKPSSGLLLTTPDPYMEKTALREAGSGVCPRRLTGK